MKLTEFLVKSPKLNEIPKPGIKSQLKMEPHGKQMFYTKKNILRFVANDVVILSNKKSITFLFLVNRRWFFLRQGI